MSVGYLYFPLVMILISKDAISPKPFTVTKDMSVLKITQRLSKQVTDSLLRRTAECLMSSSAV